MRLKYNCNKHYLLFICHDLPIEKSSGHTILVLLRFEVFFRTYYYVQVGNQANAAIYLVDSFLAQVKLVLGR